ncbi:hypothetical protein A3H09_01320 [Candidatus Falkowbacteria bacterium RIFCSPLOWO2_12_FULL_45_13]|uniref:Thioredoxin domain-containing protein n=2 Tax=Candidatus Falkowiibacteriota TaxID=1752728 RepID=A0A1F5SCE7_9BACT|nr:MAG: hypothetical protein A3H66_03105 [Candidatus Falkowbacteria bacterium RIFCSPLOWO2_02_FULL_45_21]OGF32058.1 MAG: hypothetical protein A3H09_01320 [Candidatus Falkowbacteria bacterium RIFCSPLOWO2_12_FULL_45_13]
MSKPNKTTLILATILVMAGGLLLLTGCSLIPQNNGQNGGGINAGALKSIEAADHTLGDISAPVKMIVYSDFECPFCADFAKTMKQVEENFKYNAVIAFRHYLLAGHPQALPAAMASECAAEQGKFWEMHDKLFADNAAGRMSLEQFKTDAADLGLDTAKFNQCLDSEKFKDKVIEQKSGGDKAGVTGTPTTFVNGNIYPGAYPFEDFTGSDGKPDKGMKSVISDLLR